MVVMGINDLDDTATPSELVAAVAEAGARVPADKETGVIRQRITQCICLKCPAATAKRSRHVIG